MSEEARVRFVKLHNGSLPTEPCRHVHGLQGHFKGGT